MAKEINGLSICGEYTDGKHTFLLEENGQVWVVLYGHMHKSGNVTDKHGFERDAKGIRKRVTWYK